MPKFPLAAGRADSLRNNIWLLDHDKNSHVAHSERKDDTILIGVHLKYYCVTKVNLFFLLSTPGVKGQTKRHLTEQGEFAENGWSNIGSRLYYYFFFF